MTEYMRLKGYSPATIKSYVNMIAAYARHVGKSPDLTDCEDVRAFLLYLLQDREGIPVREQQDRRPLERTQRSGCF